MLGALVRAAAVRPAVLNAIFVIAIFVMAVATMLGENPEQQVREDLRHLKQVLEAGEIPTIDGQPMGPRAMRRRAS